MNRDARGRLTTRQHADVEAAERLLERAVEEARRVMDGAPVMVIRSFREGGKILRGYREFDRGYVERVLLAATESADLLMRRAG